MHFAKCGKEDQTSSIGAKSSGKSGSSMLPIFTISGAKLRFLDEINK
jgi:hypothetical protein